MSESQLSSTETESGAGNPDPENKTTEGPTSAATAMDRTGVPMNPACLREFHIEIAADLVGDAWDSLVRRYSERARIPGFRNGKIPAGVVRSRFAGQIKSDLLEALVPKHFRETVAREGLQPISQPVVSNLELERGKPLRFTIAFEVLPEITLGDYRAIPVEKAEIAVTDADVEEEIKRLQESKANLEPVEEDRPLQDGDFAQISFQGVIQEPVAGAIAPEPAAEAKPEEPAEAKAPETFQDEVLVEIGGDKTIAGFSDNLRGARTGEEKSFEVAYPADFPKKPLAGKTVAYGAKVNGIKKKNLPELNDELAREIGQEAKIQEVQSLESLRIYLRKAAEALQRYRAERAAKEKLMDDLLAKHDFPAPETLVRRQIDASLEQRITDLVARGFPEKDIPRLDFDRLREALRPLALQEVRGALLLDKIAHAENIEVSEEELGREIETMAQQTKQTVEAIRQHLDRGNTTEAIRGRLRQEKTLHHIYSKPA